MLVAAVQSLELTSLITVRHAMISRLFGLAGLAAVVPMARPHGWALPAELTALTCAC